MKIDIKSEADGIEMIRLEGNLDFSTSPEIRKKLSELAEKQPSGVLVSFNKVQYIDSSGLATFIELFQKIKRYRGKLAFFDLSQSVRNVFEVAKLDTVFPLAGTQQEAISLLSK